MKINNEMKTVYVYKYVDGVKGKKYENITGILCTIVNILHVENNLSSNVLLFINNTM